MTCLLMRKVVCSFIIQGEPKWVEETLRRSSILPDKERLLGRGTLSATVVSDETTEVPLETIAPASPAVTFTRAEIGRALEMVRTGAARDLDDAFKVIAMERYP